MSASEPGVSTKHSATTGVGVAPLALRCGPVTADFRKLISRPGARYPVAGSLRTRPNGLLARTARTLLLIALGMLPVTATPQSEGVPAFTDKNVALLSPIWCGEHIAGYWEERRLTRWESVESQGSVIVDLAMPRGSAVRRSKDVSLVTCRLDGPYIFEAPIPSKNGKLPAEDAYPEYRYLASSTYSDAPAVFGRGNGVGAISPSGKWLLTYPMVRNWRRTNINFRRAQVVSPKETSRLFWMAKPDRVAMLHLGKLYLGLASERIRLNPVGLDLLEIGRGETDGEGGIFLLSKGDAGASSAKLSRCSVTPEGVAACVTLIEEPVSIRTFAVSADGRYVAYIEGEQGVEKRNCVFWHDIVAKRTTCAYRNAAAVSSISVSPSGLYLAMTTANREDRKTGGVDLVVLRIQQSN